MNYSTLRFPDADTAQAIAQDLGVWNYDTGSPSGTTTIYRNGRTTTLTIDDVGAVVDVEADVDPVTGAIIVPATYLPGYYWNVIGELPPELSLYAVRYGSDNRVFAGTQPDDWV